LKQLTWQPCPTHVTVQSRSLLWIVLHSSKWEICLLTLLPGENDASIDCNLCITSLGDYSTHKEGVYQWSTNKTFTHDEFKKDSSQQWAPKYEALSYTWGSPVSKRREIRVNGSLVEVTLGLFQALQALWRPDEPRVLWIDTLCIYQDRYRSKCCRNLRGLVLRIVSS
jgi:Heterokaryon incompatibility protein (HET)